MITGHAADRIRAHLARISDLYYRLVLVVGPSGCGKATVLRAIGKAEGAPVLPVGIEVARRLLYLSERQRVLQLPSILQEAAASLQPEMTLLDNTEVPFSPVLKQDSLRLLQRISRNRTVIGSWQGCISAGQLILCCSRQFRVPTISTEDLLMVVLTETRRSYSTRVD